jgi:hypothetical protein
LISGFQAPLHNGPVWSSALPRDIKSLLRDPYINSLLQAYVQFAGFNMAEGSKIAQLHSSICLRFVSTTMPALNPKLLKRATSESVVVGPGNVSPLTLGFCQLTEIEEWSAEYEPISAKIQPPMPKELTVSMNSAGKPVLKLGRSQSQRIQDLDRQFSNLSTSTSRSDSVRHTPVHSPPRNPVYKPVSGRSKLDDHLLHHTQGSKNCYYCKRNFPTQEPCSSDSLKAYPSVPQNFRTYQSKVDHHGQHPDCSECQDLAVPTIKMFDSPLPRSGKEKRTELPYRHLGPGNHIPKFQNDMVADLDFIKYRKSDADPSQDIIRLQNYSNYQSVCLAQNLDDIAQDVIKTQRHLNGLHSEIDNLEHGQEDMKLQLHTILEKLEVIEKAVANLKFSYQEESQPASPVLIPETSDATFSFFGPPTSSTDQKFLTLKQLASSLANPTLIRIAEVSQLAIENLS